MKKSFLLLVALFRLLAALRCVNYVSRVHDIDMTGIRSTIFRGYSNGARWDSENCGEGEFCISDSVFYALSDGRTAGFVDGRCVKKGHILPQNCGWLYQNHMNHNAHDGYESVYRCSCNSSDYCLSSTHIIEQFKFAYSDRTDRCDRVFGDGWNEYKREDGRLDCIKLPLKEQGCSSFSQLEMLCREQYARVATVLSPSEQKQIKELIHKEKVGNIFRYDEGVIYLGGERIGNSALFLWTEEESLVKYANWGEYPDHGDCIAVSTIHTSSEQTFGQWLTRPCTCENTTDKDYRKFRPLGAPCTRAYPDQWYP